MLDGGEDPLYIARRLVRFAVEDIGMADPNALAQALAAWDTYDRLGSPEGELAIAQAVVYLGTAPKSNAVYTAFGAARRAAKQTGSLMPPMHILNAPTKLMKDLGYGKGYDYDHDAEDGFSGQNYFPDGMAREEFYQPGRPRLRARDRQAPGLLEEAAREEIAVAWDEPGSLMGDIACGPSLLRGRCTASKTRAPAVLHKCSDEVVVVAGAGGNALAGSELEREIGIQR